MCVAQLIYVGMCARMCVCVLACLFACVSMFVCVIQHIVHYFKYQLASSDADKFIQSSCFSDKVKTGILLLRITRCTETTLFSLYK